MAATFRSPPENEHHFYYGENKTPKMYNGGAFFAVNYWLVAQFVMETPLTEHPPWYNKSLYKHMARSVGEGRGRGGRGEGRGGRGRGRGMVTNNVMPLSWGSNRNYPQYQTLREHRYWFRTISEKSWFSGRIQNDLIIVSASILKLFVSEQNSDGFSELPLNQNEIQDLNHKNRSLNQLFLWAWFGVWIREIRKKCNLNHTLNKYWKRSEFRSDLLLNLPQRLVWAYIRWEKNSLKSI